MIRKISRPKNVILAVEKTKKACILCVVRRTNWREFGPLDPTIFMSPRLAFVGGNMAY